MNVIFKDLPLPQRQSLGEYDCSDGVYQLAYGGSNEEEFCAVEAAFEKDGFIKKESKALCSCRQARFIKGALNVNLFLASDDSVLRIVADSFTAPYKTEPSLSQGETTLWQFEVDHSLIDCGMCYIVKCASGGFFIVDSAHTYSVNDNDRIYQFLRQRTPENKKIVIEGWFFSHGHSDHICKFMDFLRYNTRDVEIKALYYNFVDENHKDNADWDESEISFSRSFRKLVAQSGIPLVKLHTGQHFCVDNLEFDVLCTHEDIFPATLGNYNDSSTVIRMAVQGSTVLFPGDAGHQESDILTERYGEWLKCDVVQSAHHAHFGATSEFYELARADVVLFPTTQIMFDRDFEIYEENKVAARLCHEYHIASNGTVEIPLPYKRGQLKRLPDETFEDFNGIFNLWTYEYTEERKSRLYADYLARGGRPIK